jgi:hypothetical protein
VAEVIDIRQAALPAPVLPSPRGPLSRRLIRLLQRPAPALGELAPPELCVAVPPAEQGQADLADEDFQLALYLCYELHYRGLAGVDDAWEWQPDLIALRSGLEHTFLAALAVAAPPAAPGVDARRELWELAHGPAGGRSLSGYMAGQGTLAEMRELCIHRSAYQLKEADPHTWAIPRLGGRAKAAMVEIQKDEYGEGEPECVHATLFADTMDELGLDTRYGSYLDMIPAPTLATVNLVSMLGLHRRWRGALVGHLALFEMTSVGPMGRYSDALGRLGLGGRARRFYDVHVQADARHEVVALDQMVSGLLDDEPRLAPDVVTGARWLTEVERRFSDYILDAWESGLSSLRRPQSGSLSSPRALSAVWRSESAGSPLSPAATSSSPGTPGAGLSRPRAMPEMLRTSPRPGH